MDKQRFYINLDCCSIRQKNTGLGHLTILKFTLLINSIQILDQSNLRKGTMASVEIALVCGLKVRVGCQDRLRVNSDADETLA